MKDPDHPEPSTSLNRFVRKAQRAVGLLGEVNVRIATNTQMRRLNREFLGKDKPTDVLSFPSYQNGNASRRRGMPRLYKSAGDIAISADIARANAESLGHTIEQEMKILVLHGLLHLAGYDHESDRGEMRKLEQRLRAELALPTGLIERSESGASPGGSPLLQQGGAGLQSSVPNGNNKKGFSPGQSRRPALKRKVTSRRISGALKRSSPLLKQGASTAARRSS
jgi:probable rRNA maturation factor